MFREKAKVRKLVEAAAAGAIEELEELLAKGVPLDQAAEGGAYNVFTPIEAAAQGGSSQAVRLILEHDNNVINRKHRQAACIAARKGDRRILDMLLDQGVDPTVVLAETASKISRDTAAHLVEAGAEVSENAVTTARAYMNRDTALYLGQIIDPQDAAAWEREQDILANGTDEEKAALEKQKSLAPLFNALSQLQEGLDILKNSPALAFDYSITVDEAKQEATIATNVPGTEAAAMLTLVVSVSPDFDHDMSVAEHTGEVTETTNEKGWLTRDEEVLSFYGTAEHVVEQVVSDVMFRAVQRPPAASGQSTPEAAAEETSAEPQEDKKSASYRLRHVIR